MRLNKHLAYGAVLTLLALAGLSGCGDNTAAPVPAEETITVEVVVYPVAGYDNIYFVDSADLHGVIPVDRECGDPGDGWQLVPDQPNPDCGIYYYQVVEGKGLICGPPDCATNQQMRDMYDWLIRYMLHMGFIPTEG